MACIDIALEKRVCERISVEAPAQILLRGREVVAKTLNISLSGVALETSERPQLEEEILIYIDKAIRVRGVVARLFRGGFAVRFFMTRRGEGKIRSLMSGEFKRKTGELAPESRRYQRVKPTHDNVECVLENGETHDCMVNNFSIVGAAVVTHLRPRIGSKILLGSMECIVVRYTTTGFAVEFPDYWKSMRPHDHGRVTQ